MSFKKSGEASMTGKPISPEDSGVIKEPKIPKEEKPKDADTPNTPINKTKFALTGGR